eukprot:497639-Amorphochlora_amoeboformis.AAC.1
MSQLPSHLSYDTYLLFKYPKHILQIRRGNIYGNDQNHLNKYSPGPPEGVPVVERQEILKEQYDFKCWCDQCNREVMAAAMIY